MDWSFHLLVPPSALIWLILNIGKNHQNIYILYINIICMRLSELESVDLFNQPKA